MTFNNTKVNSALHRIGSQLPTRWTNMPPHASTCTHLHLASLHSSENYSMIPPSVLQCDVGRPASCFKIVQDGFRDVAASCIQAHLIGHETPMTQLPSHVQRVIKERKKHSLLLCCRPLCDLACSMRRGTCQVRVFQLRNALLSTQD